MKVTSIVNIDLSIRQNIPFVDAVQGDSGRAIEFRLFDKGQPFIVPDGAVATIKYKRADGSGGTYQFLESGEQAYQIVDNKVLVSISEKAIGVAGNTEMQVSIKEMSVDSNVISTFTVTIRVEADPSYKAPAPGEDNGESITAELQPLKIYKQGASGITTLLFSFDGKEPEDLTLPTGFYYVQQSDPSWGHYLCSIDFPEILDGTFYALTEGDTYSFKGAYALPQYGGGNVKKLYVIDIEEKQQHIFTFVIENGAFTDYTIETSNIIGGGDAPSGGQWRLAKSITLESDVYSINITTDNDGNPLNFSEGFMTWYNPTKSTNCDAYITITGEKGNLTKTPFGSISSGTNPQATMWYFDRVSDQLLFERSSTQGNVYSGDRQAYPKLLDIGNIAGIKLETDGTAHLYMMAGATLNLYVKE